jgi:hypothetical protein
MVEKNGFSGFTNKFKSETNFGFFFWFNVNETGLDEIAENQFGMS